MEQFSTGILIYMYKRIGIKYSNQTNSKQIQLRSHPYTEIDSWNRLLPFLGVDMVLIQSLTVSSLRDDPKSKVSSNCLIATLDVRSQNTTATLMYLSAGRLK